MFDKLWCFWFGHVTYRERRKLHGVQVVHFRCWRCDGAWPAVSRSAKEHRQAVKVGAHQTARIVRPANVTPIARGKRA